MKIVRYYPRAVVGDGGMTHAVRRWSQGLARHGADVVVAFEDGSSLQEADGITWIPVQHAGPRWGRVPVGLEDVLRGADLLVLHSGWVFHNVRAAAAARRMGVPYLVEPRGAYDPHIVARKAAMKRAWWLTMERNLVREARAIHVFFESERAHLEAIGYRGPVVVAPNGVDVPEDVSWAGDRDGYLLWLGRFDPEHKGLDLLLEAARLLPTEERPFLRLHGPDWRRRKRKVTELVARMGLQDRVAVGGPAYGTGKRSLLSRAAAFVYPSRWDACPNSVLEAVSYGVPSLVTTYPLGRELASRHAAVMASPDPVALAEGLGRVTSPEAVEMGLRGASVLRQEFRWDLVAGSWLQQVEELL